MAYPDHEEATTAQPRGYCFAARKPYISTVALFKEAKTTAMVLSAKSDSEIRDKRTGRWVFPTSAFFVSKSAKTLAGAAVKSECGDYD